MAKGKYKEYPFTGADAAAEAMRQIDPEVVPVYPITPQTAIAQKFAQFVADGKVTSELIHVESEHSALSAAVGASAAGVRSMTATSSAGFALMWEVLGVASGLRLPIVMNVVNRALSAPINIHCDHSDTMGGRDHSWVQIYSERAQEVYENTFLALKIAEDISLPVMVMQDGFKVSHGVENVSIYEDKDIRKYIGERTPEKWLLNVNDPVTMGPLQLTDYNFETKYQQEEAIRKAFASFKKAGTELSKITGRRYPLFESYRTNDAEAIIVVLSSTAGTAKAVVDSMRKKGKKVGVIKPIMFRPFPYEEISKALSRAKAVAVLDRSCSYGAYPPLFSEIMNSLYPLTKRPALQSYVFGLGGREIYESDIEETFNRMLKKDTEKDIRFIGLRR